MKKKLYLFVAIYLVCTVSLQGQNLQANSSNVTLANNFNLSNSANERFLPDWNISIGLGFGMAYGHLGGRFQVVTPCLFGIDLLKFGVLGGLGGFPEHDDPFRSYGWKVYLSYLFFNMQRGSVWGYTNYDTNQKFIGHGWSWAVGSEITFRQIASIFVDEPRINDRLGLSISWGKGYIEGPESIKGNEHELREIGLTFRF